MKAIQIRSFGDPAEVLDLVELDEPPAPGPGQVLVATEYSPLNLHDLFFIGGQLGSPPLPAVPGNEGVARVLRTGPDVTSVSEGDHVVLPLLSGAWRERLLVSAAGLFALPDGDIEQLAMLGSNPPTAGLILSEYAQLEKGDWVAQDAANGGVGRSFIALARSRGLRTINLVRDLRTADELRAMGADVVVADRPGAADEARTATDNAPVTVAADGVGGDSARTLLDLLAPGGTLVSYGNATGREVSQDDPFVVDKKLTVTGIFVAALDNVTKVVPVVAETAPLVASGALRVPVAGVYDLSHIQEAVAHLRRGGKILLRVG